MMIIKKIGNGIKNWWRDFTMSADEKYLSQAIDVVDLENRMRNLESSAFRNRGLHQD